MPEARRVTVFLLDDHPMYREGVANAIGRRPELELVGVATEGRGALDQISRLRPDVALLDIQVPGLDGLAVVKALTRDELQTRAIFLSAYYDQRVVYDALSAGAAGFLSKEALGDEICESILRVARGETVLGADIQSAVAQAIREREPLSGPVLSPREREVLRLTADGRSAPQIAAELYLSPTTVKTHLQRIYEKLGVSDRAAAVREAMRHGLIE